MNTEVPRTLVIADGDYPEVDSVGYSDCFPNVAEYDVVILDLVNLNGDKAKILQEIPELSEICIHNLLWAGHKLILITDGRDEIQTSFFKNLPISIHLEIQQGSSVQIEDETYREYYNNHVGEEWNYYLKNVSFNDSDARTLFPSYGSIENNTKIWFHNIAKNGFNKPISFFVKYGYSYRDDRTPRNAISGPIVFLQPPNKTQSVEAAIKTLLSNLGFHIKTRAPTWVAEFKVHGEEEKGREIDKLRTEIQKIEERIKSIEKEKDEIICFKELLYETGNPLRDIVWKTLEEIGFRVNKYDQNKEDGSIEEDDNIMLLEIKGKEKSAARRDLRELDDWIEEYLEQGEEEPGGLFVVNHYRLIHPNERDDPFPHNVRNYLARSGSRLCAITSLQLFNIYCRIKENELSGEEIKKRIMENRGVFEFLSLDSS